MPAISLIEMATHNFYLESLRDHFPLLATRAFVGKLFWNLEPRVPFTAVT